MLDTVATVVVAVLGVHIIVKFAFSRCPVAPDRAAPPQTSPLKEMSYAIQDAPWRPWPQLLTLTVLVVFSLVSMW